MKSCRTALWIKPVSLLLCVGTLALTPSLSFAAGTQAPSVRSHVAAGTRFTSRVCPYSITVPRSLTHRATATQDSFGVPGYSYSIDCPANGAGITLNAFLNAFASSMRKAHYVVTLNASKSGVGRVDAHSGRIYTLNVFVIRKGLRFRFTFVALGKEVLTAHSNEFFRMLDTFKTR